jgi:hypothetical protein
MTNQSIRPIFRHARIEILAVVTLLVLLVAGACGDSSTSPAAGSIAGTYTLRTLGGATLPLVISNPGANKVEILDDTFVLKDEGTWAETGHKRTTISGQASTQTTFSTGTFTRNGALITMVGGGLTTLFATVSNDTLTVSQSGVVAVYLR